MYSHYLYNLKRCLFQKQLFLQPSTEHPSSKSPESAGSTSVGTSDSLFRIISESKVLEFYGSSSSLLLDSKDHKECRKMTLSDEMTGSMTSSVLRQKKKLIATVLHSRLLYDVKGNCYCIRDRTLSMTSLPPPLVPPASSKAHSIVPFVPPIHHETQVLPLHRHPIQQSCRSS